MTTQDAGITYAGFWIRTAAALIDTVIIIAVTTPVMIAVYGWAYFDGEQTGVIAGPADLLVTWIAPAVAVILFWHLRQATPGKMMVHAKVVDAQTGASLSLRQSVGRYLAYFVALLPLGLGILWVAIDRRKQGWHDKLAGTVVIRSGDGRPEPVRFGPG
jgi:uncharacterized RDD family membrane protein YckC